MVGTIKATMVGTAGAKLTNTIVMTPLLPPSHPKRQKVPKVKVANLKPQRVRHPNVQDRDHLLHRQRRLQSLCQ